MYKKDNAIGSTSVNAGLKVDAEHVGGRRFQMKCRVDGKLIHSDTLDPHDAQARARLGRALDAKVKQTLGTGVVTIEDVERTLLDVAERVSAEDKTHLDNDRGGRAGRAIESVADPDRLARLFIRSKCQSPAGPILRSYQGRWYLWDGVSYVEVPEGELDAKLVLRIKAEFDKYSIKSKKAAQKVTKSLLANVRLALTSKLLVPGNRDMPWWIGGGPWPEGEVLAARNGLFHLPSLAEGVQNHAPPSPRFFSTFALDYDILANPEPPVAWLGFLSQLWPADPDCIATLQEFMGYCLTNDTSQQKILLVVGPPRSGKGTIARVMTGLVGAPRNVAGPTAASLKTNFGLQDLVGKPLAIIADAQLKKHDDGLVERLKMISGEDMITVDKKYVDPVTVKLPTRLVIMSNDLPRFKDTSGALANRMIILPLSVSFLAREDPSLGTRLLAERPGILAWAIAGWKRLNERGRFVQPVSAQTLLEELTDLSSPIGHFVRESCRVGSASLRTPRKELYDTYLKWCVGKGYDYPLSSSTFGVELRAVVPGLGESHPVKGGKRVWCYTGVSLKKRTRPAVQAVQAGL